MKGGVPIPDSQAREPALRDSSPGSGFRRRAARAIPAQRERSESRDQKKEKPDHRALPRNPRIRMRFVRRQRLEVFVMSDSTAPPRSATALPPHHGKTTRPEASSTCIVRIPHPRSALPQCSGWCSENHSARLSRVRHGSAGRSGCRAARGAAARSAAGWRAGSLARSRRRCA